MQFKRSVRRHGVFNNTNFFPICSLYVFGTVFIVSRLFGLFSLSNLINGDWTETLCSFAFTRVNNSVKKESSIFRCCCYNHQTQITVNTKFGSNFKTVFFSFAFGAVFFFLFVHRECVLQAFRLIQSTFLLTTTRKKNYCVRFD